MSGLVRHLFTDHDNPWFFSTSTAASSSAPVSLKTAPPSRFPVLRTAFNKMTITLDDMQVPRTPDQKITCCNDGSGKPYFFPCQKDCSKDNRSGNTVAGTQGDRNLTNAQDQAEAKKKAEENMGKLTKAQQSVEDDLTSAPPGANRTPSQIDEDEAKVRDALRHFQYGGGPVDASVWKRWPYMTMQEREDMIYGKVPPPQSEMGYTDIHGVNRMPAAQGGSSYGGPKPPFGRGSKKRLAPELIDLGPWIPEPPYEPWGKGWAL